MAENQTTDDRFAPPVARVDDVADAVGGLQLASRGTRLLAVIVDTVILLAALWLLKTVTPWNPFGREDDDLWSFDLVNSLGGYAVFLLVNGYLLVFQGQTVAKYLLKIKIRRTDGSLCSPLRILGLRYGVGQLAGLVPAVGMLYGTVDALFIFQASKRCLHDLIADTIVVKC